MRASIFIPTKNAGEEFYHTLNQISKQNEKDFEVIVVDSGSEDHTISIAKSLQEKFPIKIYKILPKEFGHGKTRNLSLKYAKGEFIVFLTQDAIPFNENWLSNLLINFKDKKVAGVFSRQIPKKNSRETEKFLTSYYFPDKKIIRPNKMYKHFPYNVLFSDVSSCIKKSILAKHPFNISLIASEDLEWSMRIIGEGYKTIYEPKSIVIHSHNYNFKQTFQRHFESAVSLEQIEKINPKKKFIYSDEDIIAEFEYILNKKPVLIPYLIISNKIKNIGSKFGTNHKILPLFLKKRFSIHKNYWKSKNNLYF